MINRFDDWLYDNWLAVLAAAAVTPFIVAFILWQL